MKKIPLTRGQFAIVDDADFEWLNQYKWCAAKNRHTGDFYATTSSNGKQVSMHRIILGLKIGDNELSDHRNNNTLDNRRLNLRVATKAQNNRNRKPEANCSSQYKGVSWCKSLRKWKVAICFNGKVKHLGYYYNEIWAAGQYDIAASKYFSEFAYLNFNSALNKDTAVAV